MIWNARNYLQFHPEPWGSIGALDSGHILYKLNIAQSAHFFCFSLQVKSKKPASKDHKELFREVLLKELQSKNAQITMKKNIENILNKVNEKQRQDLLLENF